MFLQIWTFFKFFFSTEKNIYPLAAKKSKSVGEFTSAADLRPLKEFLNWILEKSNWKCFFCREGTWRRRNLPLAPSSLWQPRMKDGLTFCTSPPQKSPLRVHRPIQRRSRHLRLRCTSWRMEQVTFLTWKRDRLAWEPTTPKQLRRSYMLIQAVVLNLSLSPLFVFFQ